MGDVVLTLREARDEALDTKTFVFDAEGLGPFLPGQYLLLRLDAPEDPRRGSRSFTLSSAPSEERVMITTRIRPSSPFKRALASLIPGRTVAAKGPLGRFVLPEGDTPVLLLAGGIGVTPFRSMVAHAVATGRQAPLVLVTSDRIPEVIVFRNEFDRWREEHPWLTVLRTVTRLPEARTPWEGRTGRIDVAFLREVTRGLDWEAVLLAGPPAFVDGLQPLLASAGIPADRIRTERFIGY